MGLLAVPGASSGAVKERLEGDQLFEPFAGQLVARGDGNPRRRPRQGVAFAETQAGGFSFGLWRWIEL